MKRTLCDRGRSAEFLSLMTSRADVDPKPFRIKKNRRQYALADAVTDVLMFAFIMLFWLLSESVLASAEPDSSPQAEQPPYRSLWLKSHDGVTNYDATTLATDVAMRISGPILRARVRQQFRNPSQVWAEGVYTFPLPEQATVDRMRMLVGERVIEGQIHEKQAAKKIYQKAREAGKRSSLLSHHRSNRFTTTVANIGPGESVTVEFEYQQVLDFRDQRYSFRFPMVTTPQYTPPQARLDREFIAPVNAVKKANERPGNPVSISIDLKAGFPIKTPLSTSHSVKTNRLSETHYQVALAGAAPSSNRDFILSWQLEASAEPMVSILREEVAGASYGLLMVMPPQALPGTENPVPRELVLVLDVSGSMQGESIEQARLAMLKAIGQLGPEDYFNIVFFNTRAWTLFSGSQPASNANLNRARRRVLDQKADGGTEMRPALHMALTGMDQPERLRQVVFITDGAVSNEAELFAGIQRSLGRSRLFTVGIGSAPNSYFMRKAALAGRGTFTYISKPDEVSHKINHLLRQLASPALTDLRFHIDNQSAVVLPQPLPDLYLGEPVYVAFKADSFPEHAVLSGDLAGVPSRITVPLQSSVRHDGVAVEWARRKISSLAGRYREANADSKQQIRNEIIDLAVKHHQVSKFTSLVAVDVSPVRGGGLLQSQRIKPNRPKGWRGSSGSEKNQIRLAQTATDARYQLLTGAALLFAALCLCFGSRYLRRRATWFRDCPG